MKVLVTGAKGFVGRNLIVKLRELGYNEIFEYDIDTDPALLDEYTRECDYVFHLAGVNRPKDEKEFMEGNFGFTSVLLNSLESANNKAGIAITSSIQAAFDNPYGISKKAGEDLMRQYGEDTGSPVTIFRLPNVFGKWCRPNYNSAVATFCNNIAKGLDIKVNDPSVMMHLVYVDDVVNELILAMEGKAHIGEDGFAFVPCVHDILLGDIPKLLYSFRDSRKSFFAPDLTDSLTKKLYDTYVSYLSECDFAYPLITHKDNRGAFTEIMKDLNGGSLKLIKLAGSEKSHTEDLRSFDGVHDKSDSANGAEIYNNSDSAKVVVIKGSIAVDYRNYAGELVATYYANADNLKVLDVPAGYRFTITNCGKEEALVAYFLS